MDLRDLRVFVTVVDADGFTRAAERLHIAQPAVSQQIQRLERQLGATLLRRTTRRLELTIEGEQLLRRARVILADVERTHAEIREVSAGRMGRVVVGFVGTATYDLLPKVVRRLREQLPEVDLEVHGEQLAPAMHTALLERRIDLAITRNADTDRKETAVDGDLVSQTLRSERLVAVLPADHSLLDSPSDRIALSDLTSETFITHPSGRYSAVHGAVMAACARAGFTPAEVVEVRETATLVSFVAAGIGVALVPEPVQSLTLNGVAFRHLSDIESSIDLVLTHAENGLSPAALAVSAAVRAVARQAH